MSYKWKLKKKKELAILYDVSSKKELVRVMVGPQTRRLSRYRNLYLSENQETESHLRLEPPERLKGSCSTGYRINYSNGEGWHNWEVFCSPVNVIFPTREGELITELDEVPRYSSNAYRLSYPGTASAKCIVILFSPINNATQLGLIVGSEPSFDWAELSMERRGKKRFMFTFFQKNRELYVIPFKDNWKDALNRFRTQITGPAPARVHYPPRYFLQMGVRNPSGKVYKKIKRFADLLRYIERFRTLGSGNVVHLFGTNTLGFDCGLPDYGIDPDLGGREGLRKLVDSIHEMGLKASHHYNPRIADLNWVDQRPEYQDAIVLNVQDLPWVEFYKRNKYYVMDPGHKPWREFCLNVIKEFWSLGFDYVQIDQIAYQRVMVGREQCIGQSYQQLIDEALALAHEEPDRSIHIWIEGVSDIYRIDPAAERLAPRGGERRRSPGDMPNFFQILPRERVEFWETGENRRGYAYGESFPEFFMQLVPTAQVSMQIVTEARDTSLNTVRKKMKRAKRLDACIYDIELGFVDEEYDTHLDKMVKWLMKYQQEQDK